MKNKVLIIICLMCFLSGCTANYKININKEGIVDESVTLAETKDKILTYSTNTNDFVSVALDDVKNDSKYNTYSLSINSDSKNYFGVGKKSYLDLEKFKKDSIIINEMFDSISIVNQNNIVKITMIPKSTYKYFEDSSLYSSLLDKVNIEINIPYVVKSSNADEVKENVYIWNIEKNKSLKTISISYDTNNIKSKPIPTSTKILIGVGIVILVGGIYIFIRYKRTGI